MPNLTQRAVKAMDATNGSNIIQEAVKAMDVSAVQRAVEAIDVSAIQRAMDATNGSNIIQEAVKAIDVSAIQRAMDATNGSNIIQEAVKARASLSISATAKATAIQANPVDIPTAFEHILNENDSSSFYQLFNKIPPLVQSIILFIILEVLLPQTNNILSNLATPHIESLIASSKKINRELIKDIASVHIDDLNLDQYRFVTVDILRLRELASTKSTVLDNLQLGQILTVISKDRNWLNVTYSSNGKVMRGWVFSRYTAKFQKHTSK